MKGSRRRYLSFNLYSERPELDDKKLGTAIWKSMLSLFGEVATADSKLYIVEYSEESGHGILQCTTSALDKVILSAVLIGTIGDSLVSFEPVKVSGTIKSLKRKVPSGEK